MYGFIFYFIAWVMFTAMPMSNVWAMPFIIGLLFHWKFVLAGTIAFFIGAGWRKPF